MRKNTTIPGSTIVQTDDDTVDIFSEGCQDPPVTLDDIYEAIGDLDDLLDESTQTWGSAEGNGTWKQFEERFQMSKTDGSVQALKCNFIAFVQRAQIRVSHFHLDQLALVDLEAVDLEEVREGWADALRKMQQVLTWLAAAEVIIGVRFVN